MSLFKQLGVDVITRWRSAHSLVLESDEWQSDEELRQLPGLDILLAFEDYSRVREREFEDEMRRKQVNKLRSERKAREAFKVLSRTSFSALSPLNVYRHFCKSLSLPVRSRRVPSGSMSIRNSHPTAATSTCSAGLDRTQSSCSGMW